MSATDSNQTHKPHCLVVPFPLQGHINPILQFAKRLTRKQIRVTFSPTKFLLKTTKFSDKSISLRAISDGFDVGGRSEARSSAEYLTRLNQSGQETLAQLLQELADSGQPADCVIYDPFIPWVLDVAKGMGIRAAAFFTQSCAVDNIYYRAYLGELKLPLDGGEAAVVVPGLPEMNPEEMPSFIYDYGSYPSSFELILNQFRNIGEADWIFINTFQKLEEQVLEYMARFWQVKAIGPTIPSMYLDKRLEDDKEYGLSMFDATIDACMDWLNQRQPKSVIYVSFGSLAKLTVQQTEELAHALRICNKHFLWVIRSSEESKLPPELLEEASSKGLIVSWCRQLEVLAHEAVGCFITHCGWNSTLEAISLGVPLVAMPQWTDQSTNTKFITDVWGTGVRARGDENGLVSRDEIVDRVNNVMEGNDGEVIKLNCVKWKKLAREAVDDGGSSDKNIDEFVCALLEHPSRVI